MTKIVPKQKAPGVDFCGTDSYQYIIRSDLNCYMRSTDFHGALNIEIFNLHESCRGGDHYFAREGDHYFIIKGDNYRTVSNMNKDWDASVFTLHPNCRWGDHYFADGNYFYIVYQSRGVYRQVTNLNTDEGASEHYLNPECKDGIYYYATSSYKYFVRPDNEWGIRYTRCTSLENYSDPYIRSIHADVVSFLPGGLAVTKGPTFGRWEAIKTISNDSNSPIKWEKKITKTVGYTKKKMSSVEHNWKISISASYESGALTAALAKYQISMSAEYGGKQVNSEEENWNEATVTEEAISVDLQPHEQVYVWQYQLGFGQEAALFCRSMKFTNDSKPPNEVPLPPSKP